MCLVYHLYTSVCPPIPLMLYNAFAVVELCSEQCDRAIGCMFRFHSGESKLVGFIFHLDRSAYVITLIVHSAILANEACVRLHIACCYHSNLASFLGHTRVAQPVIEPL